MLASLIGIHYKQSDLVVSYFGECSTENFDLLTLAPKLITNNYLPPQFHSCTQTSPQKYTYLDPDQL